MTHHIKILGWHEKTKRFHEPYFNGMINDIFADGQKDGITYLLRSGLTDTHKKDIYNGDILKRVVTIVLYGTGTPPKDVTEYLEVKYREDYGGFFVGETPLYDVVGATIDVATRCKCTDVEVVGNIFENPELLLQEEETQID